MAKEKHVGQAKVHDGAGNAPQLIDPMWILKGVGMVIAAALVCGYLVLAGLFYQGAWQMVMHPKYSTATFQLPGVKMEPVRFAVDETGKPRLTGFWIPASGNPQFAVLYLRGGEHSLATDPVDARNLRLLHDAGLNVLAFEYRGYGESVSPHPSEKTMMQDAAWAFNFLVQERGLLPDHLLLFGEGLGASVASQLALQHTSAAALILNQPDASAEQRVMDDPRGRLLPVKFLLRDRFPLVVPLQKAQPPKLLLHAQTDHVSDLSANDRAVAAAFRAAASPKMTVILPIDGDNRERTTEALTRFLDTWVPAAHHGASLPLSR